MKPSRARVALALAWAVLVLGAGVAAFHAAAFAYFLMTLGLFAAVGLALALPELRRALAPWPSAARIAAPVLWAALLLGAVLHSLAQGDSQAVQRDSLRFVHRNFAPDRAGFQPETALFCGVRQPIGLWFSQRIYRTFEGPQRDREVDALIARFRSEPVHYLVESFRLNQFPTPVRVFWDENYQPYHGSVFVAGRRLQGDAGQHSEFDLLIGAPYRWLPIGKRERDPDRRRAARARGSALPARGATRRGVRRGPDARRARARGRRAAAPGAARASTRATDVRVALLTNILTPYRLPVYRDLAATPGWQLRVFVSRGRATRAGQRASRARTEQGRAALDVEIVSGSLAAPARAHAPRIRRPSSGRRCTCRGARSARCAASRPTSW